MESQLRRGGLLHPGQLVARTIGQNQKYARARDVLGERGRILFRRLVYPLKILHEDHEGPTSTALERHLAKHVEAAGLDNLGAQPGKAGRALLESQEVDQIRRGLDRI